MPYLCNSCCICAISGQEGAVVCLVVLYSTINDLVSIVLIITKLWGTGVRIVGRTVLPSTTCKCRTQESWNEINSCSFPCLIGWSYTRNLHDISKYWRQEERKVSWALLTWKSWKKGSCEQEDCWWIKSYNMLLWS